MHKKNYFSLNKVFSITYIILILLLSGCGSSTGYNSELNMCAQELRIINGVSCSTNTTSIVKIVLLDEEDNQQFCTGALIDSKTVLTSAHCFNEFVFNAYINTDSGKNKIVSVKTHPKFDINDLDADASNDVAFANLESEVPNSSILPVNINSNINVGNEVIFFGFGRLNEDDPSSAGQLRVGSMKVASVNDGYITATVDKNKKNICYGDSGGPVFLANQIENGIVGLISRGSQESCSDSTEAFFTTLSDQKSKDFIQANLTSK